MQLICSHRLSFVVAMMGCLTYITACGQKNSPPSGSASSQETRTAIQAALIEDAGIEKKVFESIARSDTPPKVGEQDSQNLTFVLMSYAPGQYKESPAKLRQEVELTSDTPPPPAKLFEPLMKNQVGDKYSIISQAGIQDLSCNVTGNQAQGNVKFRYPELFVVNVQYRAEYKDGKWRITEFLLPYHDIKLTRNEQQRWSASGAGVKSK